MLYSTVLSCRNIGTEHLRNTKHATITPRRQHSILLHCVLCQSAKHSLFCEMNTHWRDRWFLVIGQNFRRYFSAEGVAFESTVPGHKGTPKPQP